MDIGGTGGFAGVTWRVRVLPGTLGGRLFFPIWFQNDLFSLILTVFDLSRALEGHYGPRFVPRRDI